MCLALRMMTSPIEILCEETFVPLQNTLIRDTFGLDQESSKTFDLDTDIIDKCI